MIASEMAGSAYRKRSIQYFAMAGRDTSGFRSIFTESLENGTIGINLNLPYTNKTETYAQRLKKVSAFLLESKLAVDLNSLFAPYSKSVENVIIEKAFFAQRDELLKFSHVAADTTKVPGKILDCITWIKFKNK